MPVIREYGNVTQRERGKELITVDFLASWPAYVPICAHWSFMEWYLDRNVPFEANLKAYEKRCTPGEAPVTLIALSGALPVGMCSIKENDLWSRPEINPWFASLYVHPSWRNRGVGGLLLEAAEREARAMNYSRLYLFLGHNEEKDLRAFYSSRGWVEYDRAVDNDGHDTIIYYRDIDIRET